MHVDVQFRSDNGTCLWLYIAVAHCFWSYFSLLDFILEFNFYLDFNFYFGYMQNNLCWIIWMYSAYSRISANWYNKKLVTVKYILLERYHKRFPRSASSNTILAWKNFTDSQNRNFHSGLRWHLFFQHVVPYMWNPCDMHSLGQFHILRIFLKSTGESNLPSDSNILYSSCSVDLKITWSTHLLPLKRLDLSVVRHESEVTGGISKSPL